MSAVIALDLARAIDRGRVARPKLGFGPKELGKFHFVSAARSSFLTGSGPARPDGKRPSHFELPPHKSDVRALSRFP
jgi:hypothetical protein